MITDFIPSLDLLSTFFTLAYLGWLVASQFRGALSGPAGFDSSIKRSLLNQHVCR